MCYYVEKMLDGFDAEIRDTKAALLESWSLFEANDNCKNLD